MTPIYMVVSLAQDSSVLDAKIERRFGMADRYRLQGERGWLIRFQGTSVELTKYLEIDSVNTEDCEPTGSAIVVAVDYYHGKGPVDMWEWIVVKRNGIVQNALNFDSTITNKKQDLTNDQ